METIGLLPSSQLISKLRPPNGRAPPAGLRDPRAGKPKSLRAFCGEYCWVIGITIHPGYTGRASSCTGDAALPVFIGFSNNAPDRLD